MKRADSNQQMMMAENEQYESVMREQAELIKKHGTQKRKALISKDLQYFDSTELAKYTSQTKDVDLIDQHAQIRQLAN